MVKYGVDHKNKKGKKQNRSYDDDEDEEDVDYDVEDDDELLLVMTMKKEINCEKQVLGSYQTVELIETFMNYQENIKRCVCIIYDPSKADLGVLALKALKLSDSFMELYRGGNFTGEKLREKNFSWMDIFEEIPGTDVVAGRGRAVVTEISSNTAMGSIHDSMLQTDDEATPLKKKLDEFGSFLAKETTFSFLKL